MSSLTHQKNNNMKKIIICSIMVFMIAIMSHAQNHRHNLPYSDTSILLKRGLGTEYNTMYEVKTITEYNTKIDSQYGVRESTIKTPLYDIPTYLRKFEDNYIIDNVMRNGDTVKTISWSWFIVWDTQYTKENTSKSFSWRAVKITCMGFLVFLTLMWFIVYCLKKSYRQSFFVMFLMFGEDDKEFIPILYIYMGVIGLLSSFALMIAQPLQLHSFPFYLLPYAFVIGSILRLLAKLYLHYYPETKL